MAEDACPDIEDEVQFSRLLRSLHDISMELAASRDLDALCRRVVEWALANLGFDRISLWFIDALDPEWNLGTWGTDERGFIRDERGARVRRDPIIAPPEFYEGRIPVLASGNEPCYDDRRNVVGRADKALAPLWDGTKIIGELSVDNFVSKREIGARSLEALVLFARIVGHLYSLLRTREALARASEGKDTLLRELRHRTKNNLAVIVSLVNLEYGSARGQETRTALDRMRGRVDALAALYSLLDRDLGPETVRLDEYLGNVAFNVARGYGAESRGIALELELAPVPGDADRAASLGIILNELMTDSFKYAFEGGRAGKIAVRLVDEGELALLELSDDGPGLPPGLDHAGSEGLGLGLVALLVRQIGGSLVTGPGPGAHFELRFRAITKARPSVERR